MSKKLILILFLFGFLFCNAQETKPDNINVRGKYIGAKFEKQNYSDYMTTSIKIKKRHRYRSWNFNTDGFTEMTYGKWELKNDSLFLTEKWYKKNPGSLLNAFFFGKKLKTRKEPSRKQVTQLTLIKGNWYELHSNKYTFKIMYTHYVKRGLLTYKPFDWALVK